jgi:hypothetical protein
MPGPLHAPTVLLLYTFRFRDPVQNKWVKARYVAERSAIAQRYREWQIRVPSHFDWPSSRRTS